MNTHVSTGLKGLDSVLGDLYLGDNVVWITPSILEYKKFVSHFVSESINQKHKLVYFRFSSHAELIQRDTPGVILEALDPSAGFERFTIQIYNKITEHGPKTFYIFDCLSDLLSVWATDAAISNFFKVVCPYLYELDTIAYFALQKYYHSFQTVSAIRSTTQLMLELYNDSGTHYVHPQKVYERSSPTMFLPHRLDDDDTFRPVVNSIEATSLFSTLCSMRGEQSQRELDAWDRLFISADAVMNSGNLAGKTAMMDRISQEMMGKDTRILELVKQHFNLSDLLSIKSRMIGTGNIGGKSVGFLLGRKILENDTDYVWANEMEPHDSFFIGSDVFLSYIVHNGWWKHFISQKTDEGYFSEGKKLEELFLTGTFPEDIEKKIKDMLEYFGQYPIVLRSSSILEDGFGNSFAGKYESFFCSVIGSPEERFNDFVTLLQTIYASAMSYDALIYRQERGLQDVDEQMAILVQRVSGSYHGHYYYPHVAGVGLSYNTYVWNKNIDPEAGMLRIVMGLGTRAVNRIDGDYPRLVSLSNPELVPDLNTDSRMKFSQKDLDVLDLHASGKHFVPLYQLANQEDQIPFDMHWVAVKDSVMERRIRERKGTSENVWMLTFDRLLKSGFSDTMKQMMDIIEAAYNNPVDIEFTVNFTEDGHYLINLLQCRPIQRKMSTGSIQKPENLQPNDILIQSSGQFMGGNVLLPAERMVYIDAEKYTLLNLEEKYSVARAIGKLNMQFVDDKQHGNILFGPGRWGTTSPELGVPVSFSEISHMDAIVEVEYEAGGLYPELSFGSHFFQDLVENNTFYMALFPHSKGCDVNMARFDEFDNTVRIYLDENPKIMDVIKVYEPKNRTLLYSDIFSQEVLLYREPKEV